MHPEWTFHHPRMSYEALGFLPDFLSADDPRPAREQFDDAYISGWDPFAGFRAQPGDVLVYPGDPPMKPLASCHLREERIVFYQSAWVAIYQPDGSFEIARMD